MPSSTTLNFGNPENPEVMWQLIESIEGISEACEALGVPVVGGNVSFYNETDGLDIFPTPVVGMLGLCDPMPATPPRLDRARTGMDIWLVGEGTRATSTIPYDFSASAFSRVELGHLGGRPRAPDHHGAPALIDSAVRLAHHAPVVHDVAAGGLAVALAEIAIASDVGMRIDVGHWQELFAEPPMTFRRRRAAGLGRFRRCDGAPDWCRCRRPHRLWLARLHHAVRRGRILAKRAAATPWVGPLSPRVRQAR